MLFKELKEGDKFKRPDGKSVYVLTNHDDMHGVYATCIHNGNHYSWDGCTEVELVENIDPSPAKVNRQRFWMCYVDGAEVPKHKHWSKEAATLEAMRLSRLNKKDVFLLTALDFVRFEEPEPCEGSWKWRDTIT